MNRLVIKSLIERTKILYFLENNNECFILNREEEAKYSDEYRDRQLT